MSHFRVGFRPQLLALLLVMPFGLGVRAASPEDLGVWFSRASMITPRWTLEAVPYDGKIYVVGGRLNNSEMTDVLEAYDPASNSWASKAPMPTARDGMAFVEAGGILYAIGGGDSVPNVYVGSVEAYDPATDTWAEKAPLGKHRWKPMAAAIGTKIYVCGGDNDEGSGGVQSSIEIYDTETNEWSEGPTMPRPGYVGGAAVIGGLLYVVSMNGASETFLTSLNPATGMWSTLASMPTNRWHLGVAALNGEIYVVGGADTALEIYNPASNTWRQGAATPLGRNRLTAATLNGLFYAIGGDAEGTPALGTVEAYAPPSTDAQEAVDDFVWVTSRGSSLVTKVRKSTNSVAAQIDVDGAFVRGVAVDPTSVWVTVDDRFLVRILKELNLVVSTVDLAEFEPIGVPAVDTDSVWVSSHGETNVARVNKATLEVTAIATSHFTFGVALDDAHAWFSVSGETQVIKIDKSTDMEVAVIDTGEVAPHGLAVDDDYVWAAIHNTNQVARINKVTHEVDLIEGDGDNFTVAVDTEAVWFACPGTGNVLRVSKSDLSDRTLIPVGEENDPIGISIDGQDVWVALRVSNALARIDKQTLEVVEVIEGIDPEPIQEPGLSMFGDATGYAYDFFFSTPQTPQEVIADILAGVDLLVGDTTLTSGQGNALHQKLEGALAKLNSGGSISAVQGKLAAFVSQVQALMNAGILTQSQGEALLTLVEEVLDLIGS